MRLASLSLAGHPEPERFVAEFSGSDRTVAEYLLAEMLERQPDDVQHLLMRTCLLDRVNGELADLMTGRAGAERILLGLYSLIYGFSQITVGIQVRHLGGDVRSLPELRSAA